MQRRLVLLSAPALLAACATEPLIATEDAPADGDLLATAASMGVFTSFLRAVDGAGLADTLRGPGPFTVFAPTDEGFGRLPSAQVNGLISQPSAIGQVLRLHVVEGEQLTAADLAARSSVATLGGSASISTTAEGGVRFRGIGVTMPDIQTANGILHGIGGVALPF